MRKKTVLRLVLLMIAASAAEGPARAADLADYSPYVVQPPSGQPLWGDTHLHSSASFDAGAFGNRLDAASAYRFAKGELVVSSSGQRARLSRPLDFLVVADHAEDLGLFDMILAQDPAIVGDPEGGRIAGMIAQGGEAAMKASMELLMANARGQSLSPALTVGADSPAMRSVWEAHITAAEEAYEPGRFSTLIGYEWSSQVAGNNLHRVVLYRDGAARAAARLPFSSQPPLGSQDPRDLWSWMEAYEDGTGGEVLAIPHNGNLSNGLMFPEEMQWNGRALDESYTEQRRRWEPVYEVTQTKGDSEAHPFLSPEDTFADYETWDETNLMFSQAKEQGMLSGEYAREALKTGLALEQRLGSNPYKFGMIGSTDSHTSLATAGEDNFFGVHPGVEPNPGRALRPIARVGEETIFSWKQTAAGLAAVWAPENTREAIFDAIERREVYATTGPRILLRFFGGWAFEEAVRASPDPAATGYRKGVPMGGDLPTAVQGEGAPSFLLLAMKDPIGANLDRIQIVKGWLDQAGNTQEKVYDVAWSEGRAADAQGRVPPVGSTVDPETASWTNDIGAAILTAVWRDPDFDPAQRAFYYARVIEIPTPRWTAYDKARFSLDLPPEVPLVTQERAYSSPIWYGPDN